MAKANRNLSSSVQKSKKNNAHYFCETLLDTFFRLSIIAF